ncbi:MAG: hypothetical protein K0U45_05285 [Alphaproteobacteria bacterium]|nr:hypothetical protein [Alphaproteobacteria bacterium]
MEKISTHFTIDDVTDSIEADKHGIDNSLPSDLLPFAEEYAQIVAEPYAAFLGFKPDPNSWFRCKTLNTQIGGSTKSAHLEARAGDWCKKQAAMTQWALAKWFFEHLLYFDQIIIYNTFVHVGLARKKEKSRFLLQKMIILDTGSKSYPIIKKGAR